MIAKVAFVCAIMAAVHSRSVLYGTSILDLILPNNEVEMTHLNDSRADPGLKQVEEWKYNIYEFPSNMLNSIIQKFQFGKSAPDGSSVHYDVSSNLPHPKFNEVTHGMDNDVVKDTSEDVRLIPFLIPGNFNATSKMLLEISKSSVAKDIMGNGIPGLAAFEYQH